MPRLTNPGLRTSRWAAQAAGAGGQAIYLQLSLDGKDITKSTRTTLLRTTSRNATSGLLVGTTK